MLAAALREQIPGVRFTEPDGGYFLWVELPEDVDVDKLLPAAAERGVAVVKGSDFLLDGGKHALRLAYSAVTVDEIDEGVRRLAEAVDGGSKLSSLSGTRQSTPSGGLSGADQAACPTDNNASDRSGHICRPTA